MEQTRLFIIIVTLIKMKPDFKCKNAVELNLRHQRGLLHRTERAAHSFLSLFMILSTGENRGGGTSDVSSLPVEDRKNTHQIKSGPV